MDYSDKTLNKMTTHHQYEWQRTSVSQLVFELSETFRKALGLLFFLCTGTIITSGLDSVKTPFFIGMFFTYCILVGVYRVILWGRCQFRLRDGQVEYRTGLFSREHKKINQSRFCDLEISQSFFQKLFGIYTLQLNTAGGEQCEVQLKGVSLAQLQALGVEPPSKTVSQDKDGSDVPMKRLIAASFFSWTSIAVFAGGVSSLSFIFDSHEIQAFILQQWDSFSQKQLINTVLLERPEWMVFIGLLIMLVSFFLVLLSVIVKVVLTTYPQRLWIEEHQFLVSKGAWFKLQSRFSIAKMQHIKVSQSWFGQRRGWYSLILSGDTTQSGSSACSIIGLQKHQIDQHLQDIGQPPTADLRALPYAAYASDRYWVVLLKYIGVILGVMVALLWYETDVGVWFVPLSISTMFALAAGVAVIVRNLKNDGWVVTPNFIYMRSGVFGVSWTALPVSQIQMVFASRTRRGAAFGYCEITLSTMDHSYTMPAAPLWLAKELHQRVKKTSLSVGESPFVSPRVQKIANHSQSNEPQKA